MQCPSATFEAVPASASTVLVRAHLHYDEWWFTYVARVLHANGYAADREYLINQVEGAVAALFPKESIEHLISGASTGFHTRRFGRLVVPSWALRGLSSGIQVCHRCFAAAPYVRLGWQLRTTTACAAHAVRMTTKCPICARSWFAWDAARGRCTCGFELADHLHEKLLTDAELAVGVGTFSLGAFGPGSSQTPGTDSMPIARSTHEALTEGATTHLETELEDALACDVFLHRVLDGLAKRKIAGESRCNEIRGPLEAVVWAAHRGLRIRPTVEGISQLWPQLETAVHLRAALTDVCEMRHAEAAAPTVLSRLPLTEWAEELASLGACPSKAIRRGWLRPDELTRGRVPLKQAASLAGVGAMHVKFLMAKGVVAPFATFTQGVRQRMFTKEQVERIRSHRPSAFRPGSFVAVGLEHDARNVLRLSGVLPLRLDVHGIERFDEDSLRDLLEGLAKQAKPLSDAAGWTISLRSSIFWRRRFLPGLHAVVADLRNGRLPLFTDGDSEGLARFSVGAEVLAELRIRSRVRAGDPDPDRLQASLVGFDCVVAHSRTRIGRQTSIADASSAHWRRPMAAQLGLFVGPQQEATDETVGRGACGGVVT